MTAPDVDETTTIVALAARLSPVVALLAKAPMTLPEPVLIVSPAAGPHLRWQLDDVADALDVMYAFPGEWTIRLFDPLQSLASICLDGVHLNIVLEGIDLVTEGVIVERFRKDLARLNDGLPA